MQFIDLELKIEPQSDLFLMSRLQIEELDVCLLSSIELYILLVSDLIEQPLADDEFILCLLNGCKHLSFVLAKLHFDFINLLDLVFNKLAANHLEI